MSRPTNDPAFWRERIAHAEKLGDLYRSVYTTTRSDWDVIERIHRNILLQHVHEWTTVLDVGCGYGRLLALMPENWKGHYCGVDICMEFVQRAKTLSPSRLFVCDDMRNIVCEPYDLAVLISVRGMLLADYGKDYWNECLANLRKVSRKRLYLEYSSPHEWSTDD